MGTSELDFWMKPRMGTNEHEILTWERRRPACNFRSTGSDNHTHSRKYTIPAGVSGRCPGIHSLLQATEERLGV